MVIRDIILGSKRKSALYKLIERVFRIPSGIIERELYKRKFRWGPKPRQVYTVCNKPSCKCHQGVKHGPYWVASYRDPSGQLRHHYFGKKLPGDWERQVVERVMKSDL